MRLWIKPILLIVAIFATLTPLHMIAKYLPVEPTRYHIDTEGMYRYLCLLRPPLSIRPPTPTPETPTIF